MINNSRELFMSLPISLPGGPSVHAADESNIGNEMAFSEQELSDCTDDCPSFSLCGIKARAKVVRVKDGDTVSLCFSVNQSPIRKWCVRLLGYDSCEVHTRNQEEKLHGLATTLLLEEKMLNRIVDVQFGSADKYGRWLATVYLDGENVNEWVIANSPSVPYYGATKMRTFRYECASPIYQKHLQAAKRKMGENATPTRKK